MAAESTNQRKARSATPSVTLDFDGPLVSPEAFREASGAFVDLIQGVAEEVSGEAKLLWNIQVKHGSRMFVALPVANTLTTRAANESVKAIKNGIALLQKGTEIQPPYFNQRALRGAKALSSLVDEKKQRVVYVRIKTTGKACDLTPRIIASVERLLSGTHTEFGSVEGRLRTLSDTDGNIQFVIYDDLFGKGVNCFISDDLASHAVEAFRKRVIVQGMVKYDRDGRPLSIKVEAIRKFRDPSELPSLTELYDIFNKAG